MGSDSDKKNMVRLPLGGFKEVLKMLSVMDNHEVARVLEEMEKVDPVMSIKLRDNLVRLEDIRFLSSTKMIQSFLQKISLDDLGLVFRVLDPEIVNHVLQYVTSNMKKEIDEFYKGPPISLSKVNEARSRIEKIFKEEVQSGSIVLDKNDEDRYV